MNLSCKLFILAVMLAAAVCITHAQDMAGSMGPGDVFSGRPYSPYADRSFPTNVYFGDTHVHTALSGDAGARGRGFYLKMPIALPVAIR